MPPQLLQRYGHAVGGSAAADTSDGGEWQGPEGGPAGSGGSVGSVRGSLRRKYSRLPSSASSAGPRSGSFAAAAAAALAATGVASGSRSASFRQPQQGGQALGTIPESDRASSSSGGRSRGGGAVEGTGGATTPGETQPQAGLPAAHETRPAGQPVAAPAAGSSAAAPPQPSTPLMLRLRSMFLGGPTSPPSGQQLQQSTSGASRSRSLLRLLSSRQLSRISPQTAGEEAPGSPASQPLTAAGLQQAAAQAARRAQQRPPSLLPGGEQQREQERLLAAAQRHLSRMQAAPDEATMHSEKRQVSRNWCLLDSLELLHHTALAVHVTSPLPCCGTPTPLCRSCWSA